MGSHLHGPKTRSTKKASVGSAHQESIMATKIGQYEGLFLFGTAATADVEGSVKSIGDLVTKHGGEILDLRKWDERKLAYEIKKNKRGLYVLCFFKAPGGAIEKITRDCNLSESILRHMITDASHLNLEEMKAQQPQQPVKEKPRDDFGYIPMNEFR
jgi:small subunit ribosomal protein S6